MCLMDFEKFYRWAYNAAIVDMAASGTVPKTRASVYSLLVDDKFAMPAPVTIPSGDGPVVKPGFVLTDLGRAELPTAKKLAARLLQELVRENDKLIRKIVNQIFKKSTSFTEEEDLYQAGRMAFVKTMELFDPSRFSRKGMGGSFCTYLRHWMRDYLQKSTDNQQPIHHPKGFGMPYEIYKRQEDILGRTGRVATAEELGTYKVKHGAKKFRMVQVTDKVLDGWRSASNRVTSMDAVGEAGARSGMFVESIAGGVTIRQDSAQSYHGNGDLEDEATNPEEAYEQEERNLRVQNAMDVLDPRERSIIQSVLEGDTFRKIALRMGISDEYVRQFHVAAIAKLKYALSEDA